MFDIQVISVHELQRYSLIPMKIEVTSVFEVSGDEEGVDGAVFTERPVERYEKDFDQIEPPHSWAEQFGTDNWGFLLAVTREEDGITQDIGCAAIAWNSPSLDMLEGRTDLSILWDIRVRPDHWGQGIGAALFQAAAEWSKERGCQAMRVESQNTNVRAHRFYESQGSRIVSIDRQAYRDHQAVRDEIQIIWQLDI